MLCVRAFPDRTCVPADDQVKGKSREAALVQRAKALHRVHRRLVMDRRRQAPAGMAKTVLHSLLRPLTRFVRAWQSTRLYGPAVSAVAHVPLHRQCLQQWAVAMRFDFTYDTYYRYRLYQLDRIDNAALFFPLNVNMALRSHLYDHLAVDPRRLEDKRSFYRTCAEQQLPIPRTLAEFEQGAIRTWPQDGQGFALPPCDLFSKPADSLEGKDVARWVWQGTGHYRGENGETLSAQDLLAHLAACSRSGPYILQERLTNHPAIAALGPHAVCTARIVTCRQADGQPAHLLSVFRMPAATETAAADNFAAGGFASAVDHAAGTLNTAVRKNLNDAAIDYVAYPGSAQPFAGFCLPFWKEALDLCLQAHRVFSEFPSVGWDVAITPDGPVLLEGNHDWDVALAQQPGCRPLGRTKFVESYFSFLRMYEHDRTVHPASAE